MCCVFEGDNNRKEIDGKKHDSTEKLQLPYIHITSFNMSVFPNLFDQSCSVNFSQAANGDHDAQFTCTECVIFSLCFEIHPNQSS